MKPHVLTSARSASSMPCASEKPAPSRSPASRSLSARFFAQPSESSATRPRGRFGIAGDSADMDREGYLPGREARGEGGAWAEAALEAPGPTSACGDLGAPLPLVGGDERRAAAARGHLAQHAF